MSGKLSEMIRCPASLASDQIVALCTSCELAKRKWMLSGSSFWKKSKTPWPPGRLPVITDVQAGGVSAGTIERSGARVPRAQRSRRNGMTPRSMYGSRIVQVAPSSPMSTVGGTVTPPRGSGRRCSHTNATSSATVRSRSSTGRWPSSSRNSENGSRP